MDQILGLSGSRAGAGQIVRSAFADCDDSRAVERLAHTLGSEDLALVILFLSPNSSTETLIAEARNRFAPTPVVGCTTARRDFANRIHGKGNCRRRVAQFELSGSNTLGAGSGRF